MDELNPAVVHRLRDMARHGASVPQMLREILRSLAPERPHAVTVIKYIRDAFRLSLAQAKPIAGWFRDGTGDLQDAQLDELVMPEILKNRQKWDSLEQTPSAE